MGLIKTGLIIGGIVLGLGAVGGITASVISSQKQSSETIIPQDKPDSKQTEDIQNDQALDQATITKHSLETLLNEIKEETDLVIRPYKKDKTNEIDQVNKLEKEKTYAFNLDTKQFEYTKNKDLEQKKIKLTINLDKQVNTVAKLNKGELGLSLKLEDASNPSIFAIRKLLITGFKQGSKQLNNLITTNQEGFKDETRYELVLKPISSKEETFVSIEDLNKDANNLEPDKSDNGLTSWLKETTVNAQKQQKQLQLIGKVKLEAIKKGSNEDSGKIFFRLVSNQKDRFLKLVGKAESGELEELLLDAIDTTNLSATSLDVVIKTNDKKSNEEFLNSLVSKVNSSNGFANNNNGSLTINIAQPSNVNNVLLTPYLIKTQKEQLENDLEVDIAIRFGDKEFKTSDVDNWKLLKDAGFSFQLFAKRLTKNDAKLTAMDINATSNKLSTYFVANNYKNPIAKSEKMNAKEAMEKGTFYVINSSNSRDNLMLNLKLKESGESNEDTVLKAPINLIAFANYTYTGIKNNKVLYTPNLSLIRLETKPKQVGDAK